MPEAGNDTNCKINTGMAVALGVFLGFVIGQNVPQLARVNSGCNCNRAETAHKIEALDAALVDLTERLQTDERKINNRGRGSIGSIGSGPSGAAPPPP